jgi:ornithine carbamoyltransferase
MLSIAEHRSPIDFNRMSPHDVSTVLASARTLRRAALAGATQPLLRGKNFALLCEADDTEAALFRDAAAELGAHVAQIRPSLSELSTSNDVQHTARMLGRLYDALECQGMPASLVRQVGAGAGVPVYDGIALPGHPTARLAEQLDGDDAPADKRRYVLQAVLLGTLSL